MPTEPWWGWVLLGRLHPLVVHFPIGLLIAGAVHELVQWARGRTVPSQVGLFCLSLGLAAGGVAVWFGTLNASHQSMTGDSAAILERHRYAGWAVVLAGGAALLVALIARGRPGRQLAGAYTALMLVSAACVGATGHFGGQLVYGSTYVTSVLPWNSERGVGQADAREAAPIDRQPDVAVLVPEPLPEEVASGSGEQQAAPDDVSTVPYEQQSRIPVAPSHQERGTAATRLDVSETSGLPAAEESASRQDTATTPSPDAAESSPAMARVDYARDVQPIFESTCVECHGPDKVRARLRMDSVPALQKGGKSGPLVVPGDPETSLLMRRVLGLDGEDRMPLDKDPLTDAQLEALRQWIAEGANFGTGPRTEP